MFDQVRPSVLDRTPTITFTKQYWRCIHDLLPLLLSQFYLLAYHFAIIVFKIGILVLERMITKVIIVDHLLLLGLFLLCLNFCHLVLSLCIFIWLRILGSSIEGLLLRILVLFPPRFERSCLFVGIIVDSVAVAVGAGGVRNEAFHALYAKFENGAGLSWRCHIAGRLYFGCLVFVHGSFVVGIRVDSREFTQLSLNNLLTVTGIAILIALSVNRIWIQIAIVNFV